MAHNFIPAPYKVFQKECPFQRKAALCTCSRHTAFSAKEASKVQNFGNVLVEIEVTLKESWDILPIDKLSKGITELSLHKYNYKAVKKSNKYLGTI